MTHIDHIAQRFESHCRTALIMCMELVQIHEISETTACAMEYIRMSKYRKICDTDRLLLANSDMDQLDRCISLMPEIKKKAKDVYAKSFNSSEENQVFNQEICFSYACKMLTPIGPMLHHFSNSPTKSQIVNAELALCLGAGERKCKNKKKRVIEIDLFCYETM
jgi:hypothetical protein